MNLLGLYSSTLERLMFGVCWVYQKRVSLRSGSTWSERSSERRPRRLLVENYPITPGQRLSGAVPISGTPDRGFTPSSLLPKLTSGTEPPQAEPCWMRPYYREST